MEPIEKNKRELTNEEMKALKKVVKYFIAESSKMPEAEKLGAALGIAHIILEGRDANHKRDFLNLPLSLTEITRILKAEENTKVLALTMPKSINNSSK